MESRVGATENSVAFLKGTSNDMLQHPERESLMELKKTMKQLLKKLELGCNKERVEAAIPMAKKGDKGIEGTKNTVGHGMMKQISDDEGKRVESWEQEDQKEMKFCREVVEHSVEILKKGLTMNEDGTSIQVLGGMKRNEEYSNDDGSQCGSDGTHSWARKLGNRTSPMGRTTEKFFKVQHMKSSEKVQEQPNTEMKSNFDPMFVGSMIVGQWWNNRIQDLGFEDHLLDYNEKTKMEEKRGLLGGTMENQGEKREGGIGKGETSVEQRRKKKVTTNDMWVLNSPVDPLPPPEPPDLISDAAASRLIFELLPRPEPPNASPLVTANGSPLTKSNKGLFLLKERRVGWVFYKMGLVLDLMGQAQMHLDNGIHERGSHVVVAENLLEDNGHQNLMKVCSTIESGKSIRTYPSQDSINGTSSTSRLGKVGGISLSNKLHAFFEYESDDSGHQPSSVLDVVGQDPAQRTQGIYAAILLLFLQQRVSEYFFHVSNEKEEVWSTAPVSERSKQSTTFQGKLLAGNALEMVRVNENASRSRKAKSKLWNERVIAENCRRLSFQLLLHLGNFLGLQP